MAAAGQPVFGRRAPSRPVTRAAAAPPRPAPPDLQLSAEAEAFALGLKAEGGRPDPQSAELAAWKRARRARLWKAAGIWKYLAALCAMLSVVLRLHDFGALRAGAPLLSAVGFACGAVAFWRARSRD
jgi:hypothetical protein